MLGVAAQLFADLRTRFADELRVEARGGGPGGAPADPAPRRYGRKPHIVIGMLIQAAALAWTAAADSFPAWAAAAILLAAVGDVAHPAWRARAVGVYRLWRDGGFAIGALLAGLLADLYNIRTATAAVAALTAASGLLAWARMYETHTSRSRSGREWPC